MKKLPTVVIAGRMNVGKSTLFNRLSSNVKSITLDYAGVTRDVLSDVVNWQGKDFELIDTGGVSLRKTNDQILKQVRERALELIKTADVVLLVCDGSVGLLPEDREISQLLHKFGKKVLLVVNKADTKQATENEHEFVQLGHDEMFKLSALHGRGIAELLETIVGNLPMTTATVEEEKGCSVTILGKPNVGKSSLMNALANKERSIVADLPGTTRESVTEKVMFYKQDIHITDTPGIRRKRGVTETLETLMVKSSFRAMEKTDLVLLVIDGSEGKISDQELKLAFYAFEKQYKALALLFNKNDLVDEQLQQEMDFSLDEYRHLMRKIPQTTLSCKTGKNVGRVLKLIEKVCKRHAQVFDNDELTLLFKEALIKRPLMRKTNLLRVVKVRQVQSSPITLLMIVNVPDWFGSSQLTFFENIMRKKYDLEGVPVRFVLRKAKK